MGRDVRGELRDPHLADDQVRWGSNTVIGYIYDSFHVTIT